MVGVAPLLTLGPVEAQLSRSVQLHSTQEQFRVVVVLASAISVPYLVFFAFMLLALRNSLYPDWFARAFAASSLATERRGCAD